MLIVYTAFLTGVEAHTARLSVWGIAAVILCCMALFTAMLGVSSGLGAVLKLARDERIVLLFCGTQKSVATGLPLALVMFHRHHIGLILLPLIVYYQVQVVIGSRNATRYARQPTAADTTVVA
jgi:sodium/bile acid cotransporter 7